MASVLRILLSSSQRLTQSNLEGFYTEPILVRIDEKEKTNRSPVVRWKTSVTYCTELTDEVRFVR